MPDVDDEDLPPDNLDHPPEEDSRTGEEQASVNRENEPPV